MAPLTHRRMALARILGAAPIAAALGVGLGLPEGRARASSDSPAAPAEVAAELPGARLQGSGRLRFLGLRVYDARLWVTQRLDGSTWDGTPLALELLYARRLVGRMIAERSLEEMKRQREIPADTAERWLAEMIRLFPDVTEGDRITGVLRPNQGSRFFVNGRAVGEVADPEFARLFFGIWLSPRTSEPALREALLGRAR